MPIPMLRDAVQRLSAEENAQLVDVLPPVDYEDEHIAAALMTPVYPGSAKALRLPEDAAARRRRWRCWTSTRTRCWLGSMRRR